MNGFRMSEEQLAAHQKRVGAVRTVNLLDRPIKKAEKIVTVFIDKPKPKPKMGNKRVMVDGINFASKKEAIRYGELKLMLAGGLIDRLRPQVSFDLTMNGQRITKYVADFVYTKADGTLIVEDVKGRRVGLQYYVFTIKAKMMKAVHGIEVVEV